MPLKVQIATCSALAALAVAAAPAAAVTGTQSVTADVANTITATFPGAYAWGDLTPGVTSTSAEQAITVKSNAQWGVKISSDLADGRMKEWSGAAYVAVSPKVLTNPLTWKLSSLGGVAQGGGFSALSSTAALVTGSQAATDDTGVAVGVTYAQDASFADRNAGSNDYRVLLTYDASQGF